MRQNMVNKKYEKKISGEGAQPPTHTLSTVYPSPRPTPLGACGISTPPIRKSWVRHCDGHNHYGQMFSEDGMTVNSP